MNRDLEKKNDRMRIIKSNNRLSPPVSNSNRVDNTKYGFLLFVPLFLYNQFKYFFNFFYLGLCMTQLIEPLKIGFLFTYFGPLIFVLTLSFFNEFVDEVQRWCRDFDFNWKKYP